MARGHNFTHIMFDNEIYIKVDDFIFSFYKEASFAQTEELKNIFGGIAASFEMLKNKIMQDKEIEKKVEEQKKTWWGDIAAKSYNKK